MRLMLIRHAKAGDREQFAKATGKPDAKRSLTASGKRKMKAVARGLAQVYPRLDLLASSPLKRAVQTADLIAKAYGDKSEFVEQRELAPGKRPSLLLEWLRSHGGSAEQDPDYTVAVVGHEPHLGRCASWLLTHKEKPIIALKKGGVCVLQFPEGIAAGRAVLEALLPPASLRSMTK